MHKNLPVQLLLDYTVRPPFYAVFECSVSQSINANMTKKKRKERERKEISTRTTRRPVRTLIQPRGSNPSVSLNRNSQRNYPGQSILLGELKIFLQSMQSIHSVRQFNKGGAERRQRTISNEFITRSCPVIINRVRAVRGSRRKFIRGIKRRKKEKGKKASEP